jgi:hypothetical protein
MALAASTGASFAVEREVWPPILEHRRALDVDVSRRAIVYWIDSVKPIRRVGKGARFAPCPRGYDDGGHASLCPPYTSDGIDMIRTSETV